MITDLTLTLDKDNRITAEYDTWNYPFIDLLGDSWCLQLLVQDRSLMNFATDDEHKPAVEAILEQTPFSWNDNLAKEAIAKHFDRSKLAYKFVKLNGYSQSEWAYVVLYANSELSEWIIEKGTTQEALDEAEAELQTWFRGDIFALSHEKRVVYTSPEGKTLEVWEEQETICGVTLEDNILTESKAYELFYLPELTK